jgi:hypothetical protein
MWKQVNARDKATAFAQSRMTMPVSHAGSLNIYGSGAFSDQFLHIWQSEGFPDYACVAQEETKETGLVRNVAVPCDMICDSLDRRSCSGASRACLILRKKLSKK